MDDATPAAVGHDGGAAASDAPQATTGAIMTADRYTIPPTIEDGGRTLLPWLREMRDEHPVWRDDYGIWHVFRYADVARAISDPQVFSSNISRVFPVGEKFSQGNLIRTDPPRHHTLRRLVGAVFSPKIVMGLAPRIAEVTGDLLDATGGAAEFDLVSALAYPLPVTVIAELLGLPAADRELFRSWADRLFASDMVDPNDPNSPGRSTRAPQTWSPTWASTAPTGGPTHAKT